MEYRVVMTAGCALAVLAGIATAQTVPDSAYTRTVPAAELARAIEAIQLRLGAEVAQTSVLEWEEALVMFSNGRNLGVCGWSLKLSFRPRPSWDARCSVVLSTKEGKPFQVEEGVLPDCVHHPDLCEIAITRDEAIEIARSQGLVPGSGAMAARLTLWRETGEFVWRTAARMAGEVHDRVLLINARNGVIEADYEDKPCPG